MEDSSPDIVEFSGRVPTVSSSELHPTGTGFSGLSPRKLDESDGAIEEARKALDPVPVQRARQLGFDLLGVRRRRKWLFIQYWTMTFVDETHTVELELSNGKHRSTHGTRYWLWTRLADGTTLVVEPEEVYPDASAAYVFPEAKSLEKSYRFLLEATAYQSRKRESPVVELVGGDRPE